MPVPSVVSEELKYDFVSSKNIRVDSTNTDFDCIKAQLFSALLTCGPNLMNNLALFPKLLSHRISFVNDPSWI